MKVLLDECVPWPLGRLLTGHVCANPQKQGWGGIKNGQLLALAEGEFDLFVTSDQNLRYQQNLSSSKIAILELSSNDWRRIRAVSDRILAAVNGIQPGDFIQHSV